jgi:type IV pilus assembly protein PilA
MFLQNLRAKVGARLNGDKEAGFTLIELLVVMLILGILAAIAIPAFFNQRDKAKDASAKSMARTAETAMETYATDHSGSYGEVNPAALNAIEDTVENEVKASDPYLSAAAATGGGKGYSLTVTSPATGNTFSIARSAENGNVTFSCTTAGKAGCPSSRPRGRDRSGRARGPCRWRRPSRHPAGSRRRRQVLACSGSRRSSWP